MKVAVKVCGSLFSYAALVGLAHAQAHYVRQKLRVLGVDPVGSSAEAFAAFVKSEVPKWAKVVKESGARAE